MHCMYKWEPQNVNALDHAPVAMHLLPWLHTQELVHAQHILEVREQKMVLMSRQIVEQMEANQMLLNELEERKGTAQSEDVQEMREEFTKRIGTSEKKLQAIIKVFY